MLSCPCVQESETVDVLHGSGGGGAARAPRTGIPVGLRPHADLRLDRCHRGRIARQAHIGATATVLTVAVPLAVYVLTLFALYTFLVRAVDPYHITLLAGTAALLVLPVILATIGAPMAVCLVVLMLAPLVPVIG